MAKVTSPNIGLATRIDYGESPYLKSMLEVAKSQKAEKLAAKEKREKDTAVFLDLVNKVDDFYYAHEQYKVGELNQLVEDYKNGTVDLLGAQKKLNTLNAQASKSKALEEQIKDAIKLAEKDSRIDIDAYNNYLGEQIRTSDWMNIDQLDPNQFYSNQAAAEQILKEPEVFKGVLNDIGKTVKNIVTTQNMSGLPAGLVGKITMNQMIEASDAFDVTVGKDGKANFVLKDESKLPSGFYDNIMSRDDVRVMLVKSLNEKNPGRTTDYTRDEMLTELKNKMSTYSGNKEFKISNVSSRIEKVPGYATTTTTPKPTKPVKLTKEEAAQKAQTTFYDNLTGNDPKLIKDAVDFLVPTTGNIKLDYNLIKTINPNNYFNTVYEGAENKEETAEEINKNNFKLSGAEIDDNGNPVLLVKYTGEDLPRYNFSPHKLFKKRLINNGDVIPIPIPKNISRSAVGNLYSIITENKLIQYGGFDEVGAERADITPQDQPQPQPQDQTQPQQQQVQPQTQPQSNYSADDIRDSFFTQSPNQEIIDYMTPDKPVKMDFNTFNLLGESEEIVDALRLTEDKELVQKYLDEAEFQYLGVNTNPVYTGGLPTLKVKYVGSPLAKSYTKLGGAGEGIPSGTMLSSGQIIQIPLENSDGINIVTNLMYGNQANVSPAAGTTNQSTILPNLLDEQ